MSLPFGQINLGTIWSLSFAQINLGTIWSLSFGLTNVVTVCFYLLVKQMHLSPFLLPSYHQKAVAVCGLAPAWHFAKPRPTYCREFAYVDLVAL